MQCRLSEVIRALDNSAEIREEKRMAIHNCQVHGDTSNCAQWEQLKKEEAPAKKGLEGYIEACKAAEYKLKEGEKLSEVMGAG
jgi:hypothetical protein